MASLTDRMWRMGADFFTHFRKRTEDKIYTPPVGAKNDAKSGSVYLIGAGPGDPDLLTIQAYKLIQQADVLLIDWLVGDALYPLFPKFAERIFVGKRCGQHSMLQSEINALMVEKAQAGNLVVRLKGGDPSIFGRLAEETDTLTEQGIPFTIVPGITAASGCAAYSGIPLTHRECAQSVKFVTAHVKKGGIQADWAHLAQDSATLVFYMGLSRIAQIRDNLVAHGMRENMPIAIIDQGTTQHQSEYCSTLAELDIETATANMSGPALVYVGEVVRYRQAVCSVVKTPKQVRVNSPL